MNFIKVKDFSLGGVNVESRYLNINHIIEFGDLEDEHGGWILRMVTTKAYPRHQSMLTVSQTAAEIKKLIEQATGKIAE